MKLAQRQEFSIKCQCIISKNGMLITGKKKSKFSLIILDSQRKRLIVQPFGSTKSQENMIFMISKLKTIHKKFIQEGKITIEFIQKVQKVHLKGMDVSATDEKVQLGSNIMISSASKENLELLINKIILLKKSQNKSLAKENQSKSLQEKMEPQKIVKKRPFQCNIDDDEMRNQMFSRRELLKNIHKRPEDDKKINLKSKESPQIAFFDLPDSLINTIFEYCELTLSLRVINRKFSDYILQNIHTIRVKDEIDDLTFNKLCKWAINVQCRMKNVKSIKLLDKYQHQQLKKNRAKTLKFGNWKEISVKNILELKGLRIFSLQIPYQIKFSLSQLFGIRMVELHLKSSTLNHRNDFIKSQDLAYLFKSIDLKVLELPCVNSDLLTMIERPERVLSLKLYFLADNSKDDSWIDMKKYEKLKSLSIWYVQKLGVKKENHELNIKFPQSLVELQIGQFISDESLSLLPPSLQYLKLMGQNFYNSHVQKIFLPKLKLLDITQSLNVRQQCLEYMQNLTIRTNWQRHTVDYISEYATSKNIIIKTINPKYK